MGVLAVPVFLVTASLQTVTFSAWLYEYGFRAYHVPAATGLEMEQLLSAAAQTREYFSSDQEPLRVQVVRDGQPFALYNEREVRHMADVKGLFLLAQQLEELAGSYLLGLLGVGLWFRKQAFLPEGASVVLRGSLLTLAAVLLAGLGSLLSFDRLFLLFHLVSFTNTLWMLDPSRDYLIMMYPAGFFRDATLAIGGLALAEAGALLALSLLLSPRAQVRLVE